MLFPSSLPLLGPSLNLWVVEAARAGGRWGRGARGPDVLVGSLPGFDRYFSSRTLDNNRRNIWFAEFWEDNFHCKLSRHALKKGSHVKKCTSEHARGGARLGLGGGGVALPQEWGGPWGGVEPGGGV